MLMRPHPSLCPPHSVSADDPQNTCSSGLAMETDSSKPFLLQLPVRHQMEVRGRNGGLEEGRKRDHLGNGLTGSGLTTVSPCLKEVSVTQTSPLRETLGPKRTGLLLSLKLRREVGMSGQIPRH